MMMEFLKRVKQDSIIIIAVKGLTYDSTDAWTCEAVKYMDSLGSKTYYLIDNDDYNAMFRCRRIRRRRGCAASVGKLTKNKNISANLTKTKHIVDLFFFFFN